MLITQDAKTTRHSTYMNHIVWPWFFRETVLVCPHFPHHGNDTIFWIFPVVLCHALCMLHWSIGKDLDLSFNWAHHHLSHLHLAGMDDQSISWLLVTPWWRDPTRSKQLFTVAIVGFQFGLYHVVVPLSFLQHKPLQTNRPAGRPMGKNSRSKCFLQSRSVFDWFDMHNRKVNLVGNEVTERSQKLALTPPKKSNNCDAFSLQPRCPLTLLLNISGLPPNSLHGFHIHEYGDIVSDGEFVQFIP